MKIENLSKNSDDFTGNVWHLENGESVLVDVGTGEVLQDIKKLEEVDKVIITHAHYDHVENLSEVVEHFDPEVYANEPQNLPNGAKKIKQGDKLSIAGEEFKVYETPGHKDDSISIVSETGAGFFGDLLFPDGEFGRTDLEEGDRDKLIESIKKVSSLEVDRMYCGHGESVERRAGEHIDRSLASAQERKSKY